MSSAKPAEASSGAVPAPRELRELYGALKTAAPTLSTQIATLAEHWLADLLKTLTDGGDLPKDPKIFNDPVWGSILLRPPETLLLDTPLLQRLRGIRQLGLAHLVFPGAVYDRLEHTRGVVEGVQRIVTALDVSIESQDSVLPRRKLYDLEALRLGALLHDVGHAPFSHATEALIGRLYEPEFEACTSKLYEHFDDVAKINPAELLTVLVIISRPMLDVLMHPRFPVSEREYLPARIIAAVLGSAKYLTAPYLAGLVSGPIDADKLDYMSRDAHHAGLTIGLETERLLTQLQVATVTEHNAPVPEIRERARAHEDHRYYDLAISRAGINAYEQMIVGRAILYDRIYYHHKVRAAEAMVRRLIRLSGISAGEPNLRTLLPAFTDETFICLLGGIVTAPGFPPRCPAAERLANRIRFRDLYKRAFAFSSRFLAGLDHLGEEEARDTRALVARKIIRLAANRDLARETEQAIACVAQRVAGTLRGVYQVACNITPDDIIVDMPSPDRVSLQGQNLWMQTADGHLEPPNIYFDPMKWAQAYSTKKLCGFVFCDNQHIPAVNMAARIVFADKFGVVMKEQADRVAKTSGLHNDRDWQKLQEEGVISIDLLERLEKKEVRFAKIYEDQVKVPEGWRVAGNPVPVEQELAEKLNKARPKGYTASQGQRLVELIDGLSSFYDVAYAGGSLRGVGIGQEDKLQALVRDHLRSRGYAVTEAQRVSGGQQDLLFQDSLTIENKIHRDATDDPRAADAAYAWQARRYAIPSSSEVVATVVGYVPKTEQGHKLGRNCLDARRLVDGDVVEVRLVVPVGYSTPSSARTPRN